MLTEDEWLAINISTHTIWAILEHTHAAINDISVFLFCSKVYVLNCIHYLAKTAYVFKGLISRTSAVILYEDLPCSSLSSYAND